MLDLRPNCEWCDRDLPNTSSDARICSYECTYCADCVETVLHNVCPTCGGGFERRPVRPSRAYRDGVATGIGNHPAHQKRVHSKFTRDDVDAFVAKLKPITPEAR